MEDLKKIIDEAEIDKKYKTNNNFYTHFEIVTLKGRYVYKLYKSNGKEVIPRGSNNGIQSYQIPEKAKQSLIRFFSENSFLFK